MPSKSRRKNLVNATRNKISGGPSTRKKISGGPSVGKGMAGYVKIAQTKKNKKKAKKKEKSLSSQVVVSAEVSSEQKCQEILQETQEKTGIPGYFRESIDRVVKGSGMVVASRDGNPPLVGSGNGFTRPDSPKPMSMKQKSWKKPPLKGRLAEKKRYMRPSDTKYDAMRDESHKSEHKLIPHTVSLQEIFIGFTNGDYDPNSVRIEDGHLYFRTRPENDEDNLDGVPSSEVEYRVNLGDVKPAEIAIEGEDKFLGESQFSGGSVSKVLEHFPPDFDTTQIEGLMREVAEGKIDGVFELEDKAPKDPGFETTKVWGYTTLDHSGKPVTAPVTGDVDLFAIMMPKSELLARTNQAGTAGIIKQEMLDKISSRIDASLAQGLKEVEGNDLTAVTTSQTVGLASVAEFMKDHITNYMQAEKLGFATDLEFETMLKLVENTFEVLLDKVANNELGLDFKNNDDALRNFVAHAGAILQHGPETNNPHGESPNEPTLWQFEDKGGVVRTVQTLNVKQHTQLLTGQGDYQGFFNEGEAPCQTSFIKICPGWEPLSDWLGVYEMQEQSWAAEFKPGADNTQGASLFDQVNGNLGSGLPQDQQPGFAEHMQKFKDFMNGVGENGPQKVAKVEGGKEISLTDRFDQLKEERQLSQTNKSEATISDGPSGP